MPVITDQAIVLRRVEYSETSQVLVLFGRQHGKMRVIAKGIKRSTKTRFATAVDLLEVGQVAASVRTPRQQELAILTEWKQTLSLMALRQSLPRIYAAQYGAEITAGLTEDWDPHPELYDALQRLLGDLAEPGDPLSAVAAFMSTLLVCVGSAPQFHACVSCRRSVPAGQPVHFSSSEGGLVCRDCEASFVEKHSVSPAALAVLQGRRSQQPRAFRDVFDILDYHISHLMGRRPLLSDRLASTAQDR